MSELRYDPIKDRWAIIATERKLRPSEFLVPSGSEPSSRPETCPFEYGFEHRTPPEILAIPRPGAGATGPYWQVRVVPNKFPILRVEGEVVRSFLGPFDRVAGVGAHEVIVENPSHDREMSDLGVDELALVLRAYRERLIDLHRDVRMRYVLIFKNKGREAGASLTHPHSQLIATPIIPSVVNQELTAARDHWNRKERCIFCDLVQLELRQDVRIGVQDERFVALHPFASAFPFETWILPKSHQHDFAASSDDQLRALAAILSDVLRRLKVLLNDPPYNMVLHTAPNLRGTSGIGRHAPVETFFHWHIELVPRITRLAGFEWGSGYTVNPTAPEEAARFFKDADPEGPPALGGRGQTPGPVGE